MEIGRQAVDCICSRMQSEIERFVLIVGFKERGEVNNVDKGLAANRDQ